MAQNTRQHNFKRPAYSYNLFDQLGRLIEVGQKTENSDATTFNTIFGDTVMGFYNPNVINPGKFLSWIKDNTGPRTEVIHNYFDVQDILPPNILVQQQLRNRVASITYADTLRNDSTKYGNAKYYSYDIGGRVNTFIQDDSVQGVSGQRYKQLDYNYDFVSGNINELDYENGNLDQYHQKFEFDADNRVTSVYTSKDSIMWDNDADYFYYAHEQLARVEIGDQKVQGVDYAYTLHGWPKGLNSDLLDSNRDMGHDGLQVPGNLNKCFARDAMGYTLKYFTGDYDAINRNVWNDNVSRFEAYDYHSDLMNVRHDLFNGNITAVVTDIQQPITYSQTNTSQQTPVTLPQGESYNYDQLDRLIDMKAFHNIDTNNIWGVGSTYIGMYHNWLTYDENGNILTQKRADQLGNVFDSLTYRYNIEGNRTLQNRLYHVNNAISGTIDGITNNIRDEGVFDTAEAMLNQKNNYRYNALGELAKDTIGGIDTIIWTSTFDKVWKIKKYNGDSIIFTYDGQGNKITKEFKPVAGYPIIDYYINDPNGKILAVYKLKFNTTDNTLNYTLSEREIYGSARIGSEKTPVQLIGAPPITQIDTFSRYLGNKEYEMDNYLGNIVTVIRDRKIPIPDPSLYLVDHYEADILSSDDYYPFGMDEPARNFNTSKYRFAFGGMEHTDEIYGLDNCYDFDKRTYDPRLGRYLSLDPLMKNFAWQSPYNYANNNPIYNIDPSGRGGEAHETTTINPNTGRPILTVTQNIYLYGPGATPERASCEEQDLNNQYNNNSCGQNMNDDNYFTYTDPKTNIQYDVIYNFNVVVGKEENIETDIKNSTIQDNFYYVGSSDDANWFADPGCETAVDPKNNNAGGNLGLIDTKQTDKYGKGKDNGHSLSHEVNHGDAGPNHPGESGKGDNALPPPLTGSCPDISDPDGQETYNTTAPGGHVTGKINTLDREVTQYDITKTLDKVKFNRKTGKGDVGINVAKKYNIKPDPSGLNGVTQMSTTK